MSEPLKKSSKVTGKPKRERPKVETELPDNEAMLQFFPKRAMKEIDREIGHNQKSEGTK